MKKMIRKKRDSHRFPFFAFFITSFIILAIIVLVVSNIRIHEKRRVLQINIQEQEAELEMLREKIKQADNLSLNGPDNDFMIEKMARERLLLKRTGEEVVFITSPERDPAELIEDQKEEFKWWNPFTWNKD